MNSHIYTALKITFAVAAFGVAGAMDMHDAAAPTYQPVCREKHFIRVALTADEAAGRCGQLKGMTK